jgi:hypothetical protein
MNSLASRTFLKTISTILTNFECLGIVCLLAPSLLHHNLPVLGFIEGPPQNHKYNEPGKIIYFTVTITITIAIIIVFIIIIIIIIIIN